MRIFPNLERSSTYRDCPASHIETACRKEAEGSGTFTENSSQRFLGGVVSGFEAAPVCAPRLWVSVSNINHLDLYPLVQDVLPVLFAELSSSEMPLNFNAPIVHGKDEKLN